MNRKTLIPLSLLLTIVFVCHDRASSNGDEAMPADSLSLLKAQIPAYNCAALGSKDTLYAIGNRILEAGGQQYIWNLAALDTSHYFTMEDYFVSPDCKDRLVWIEGQAGMSSGSARNLLMSILECGLDSLGSHASLGDTLETQIRVKLFQQENGRYAVQQARSVSIHNGGTSDAEIKSNLQVMVDTTIIQLK